MPECFWSDYRNRNYQESVGESPGGGDVNSGGGAGMLLDNLVLLLVLALGLAFNNSLISGAAAIVMLLQVVRFDGAVAFMEKRALQLGLILLTVSVLAPLSGGRVGISDLIRSVTTLPGILAVVGGATAAYISGEGVDLMQQKPEIIVGLMVGTIIGVTVFRGIPVGPLAASGVTAVLLHLLTGKR